MEPIEEKKAAPSAEKSPPPPTEANKASLEAKTAPTALKEAVKKTTKTKETAKPAAKPSPKLVKKAPSKPTPTQTGKRKTAIARVRLMGGQGVITVNGRRAEDYFKGPRFLKEISLPFEVANLKAHFNAVARISGGGISSQASALKHAIAKAIDGLDEKYHKSLKKMKLLTRDSRKVERKLFGHKKARKSFQFSKR